MVDRLLDGAGIEYRWGYLAIHEVNMQLGLNVRSHRNQEMPHKVVCLDIVHGTREGVAKIVSYTAKNSDSWHGG